MSTDFARRALTKLPDIASGIKNIAKQTFTLDMHVLDDAMDNERMMQSIDTFFTNDENWVASVKESIDKTMECDHLKEIIIKNFKEFIDEKIFHTHFHSRNRKTKDTNSLSVFYRHGISKIISKMVQDVKSDPHRKFFNDEIINVMEKLDDETFHAILQNEFDNAIQVESKTEEGKNAGQLDFISNLIDDTAEELFLNSPLITQDMKEELFYHLFKDDFTNIVEYFKQPIHADTLEKTGFKKIEELQDFYNRIEFKLQDKIEQKQKEELRNARIKGIFSVFTKTDSDNVTVKTEIPKPTKNNTNYVTEDSNFI